MKKYLKPDLCAGTEKRICNFQMGGGADRKKLREPLQDAQYDCPNPVHVFRLYLLRAASLRGPLPLLLFLFVPVVIDVLDVVAVVQKIEDLLERRAVLLIL